MRKTLTLDSIELAGCLTCDGEDLNFETDSEDYFPELKEAIESFFLGPCSNREMDLEEHLDRFLPTREVSSSESDTGDDILGP